MVVDMKGNEILPGQTVIVYQTEQMKEAKVVDIFPDTPTINQNGFWIDIDFGEGPEGIMSYLVKVKE